MMHLRNVWGGGVLPESIYKRAVGTVLNSVIEELIGKVWPLVSLFLSFKLAFLSCYQSKAIHGCVILNIQM